MWKGINNGELLRRDEELCDDIVILLLKKNVRHMETWPHANAGKHYLNLLPLFCLCCNFDYFEARFYISVNTIDQKVIKLL